MRKNESKRDVGEIIPGDTMKETVPTEEGSQYGRVGDFPVAVSENPVRQRKQTAKKKRSERVPLSHYIYFQFKVGVYLIRCPRVSLVDRKNEGENTFVRKKWVLPPVAILLSPEKGNDKGQRGESERARERALL